MEKWAILQRSGPGKGRILALTEGAYVLGRGDKAQLKLADSQASRRHASLRVEREAVRLKDEGSANGVFVDGQRVDEAALRLGDSFLIGQSLFFVFRLEEHLAPGQALGVWQIKGLTDLDAVSWRYRARQKVLEREVDLEVLRENFTGDADLLELYRHILRGVAAANDPGVVPVFDVSEENGRVLVARRRTALRPIPFSRLNLRDRAGRLGEFLAILLRWYERGATVPLGLDRLTAGRDDTVLVHLPSAMDLYIIRRRLHTRIPQYLPYASPEELAGADVTGREECYRLGVLLYEAMTGRLPRSGRNRQDIERAHRQHVVNARELIPQFPAPAAELLARLLSRHPQSRPTVKECAEAWSQFVFPARRPRAAPSAKRHGPGVGRSARPAAARPAPSPVRPAAAGRSAPPPPAPEPPPPPAGPLVSLGKMLLFAASLVGIFFGSSQLVYWLMSVRSGQLP
jgi:serine/threonine-protein kinase